MNIKKTLLTLIACLPVAAIANWQVVNNFDSGTLDGINYYNTTHSSQYDTVGVLDIVPRPFDGGGGLSLATSAGFGLYNDFHVWMSIPPIPDGTDGTLYLEFAQTDDAHNTTFGTIVNESPIGETLERWGNYYALSRIQFSDFDIYDSPFYETFGAVTSSTWYRIWMHIDSANDELNLYVQGGDWPEQTLVYEGAGFRNDFALDPMINFLIIQAAGNLTNPTSGGYVYWDNIHVDTTGLNLSIPEAGDPVVPVDNPFDALVSGSHVEIPNVGSNYGYQNGPGWSYHADLGFLLSTDFPWLWHPVLGFFAYVQGDYNGDGLIGYAADGGWVFVSANNPGQVYVYASDEWVDAR